MHIILPVKQVTDYSIHVYPNADGSAPDTEHTRKSLNPFDEIAAEQALQWKEAGIAETITAVTIGSSGSEEILRTCAALGADKGIHIKTDVDLFPRIVAKFIKAIALREQSSIVIMGKQNIDGDNNQTGQMLAGMMGWPQLTFCSELSLEGNMLTAGRETDNGIVKMRCPLPAVVTCDLRLNVPRRPSLPQMMKARSASIETIDAETLGVDMHAALTQTRFTEPVAREAGIKVKDVSALYAMLHEKGLLSS